MAVYFQLLYMIKNRLFVKMLGVLQFTVINKLLKNKQCPRKAMKHPIFNSIVVLTSSRKLFGVV